MSRKSKGKRDYRREYGRRPPSREPQKSILIVVEGETEKLYFLEYRNAFRLPLIDVELHVENPDCTDPINLVARAIKLKNQRKRDVKNGNALVEYDEVWTVYDLEGVHDPRRKQSTDAKKIADENNIRIAVSDPSFEFWYILHFEKTTKSFNDADEVRRYLKKHIPGYKKATQPSSEIIAKTETAIENAKWVRKQLETSQSTAPKTDVDLLVVSMQNK